MITFAVVCLKGGVGKTSLTTNLGAGLSKLGKRVLLVDLDPQNDLTRSYGIDSFQIKGIEYLLEKNKKFEEVVVKYSENLHILPGGKRLKNIEMSLSNMFVNAQDTYFCYLLRNVVEPRYKDYDYVIIDCPPYSGFLTINAMAFVENVIVPVQCQFLAFEAIKRTMTLITKIRHFTNKNIKLAAVVPTMFDGRNKLSGQILDRLSKRFNGSMSDSVIRVNAALAEAPGMGYSIFEHKPNSRGAKDYMALAEEMMLKFPNAQKGQDKSLPAPKSTARIRNSIPVKKVMINN